MGDSIAHAICLNPNIRRIELLQSIEVSASADQFPDLKYRHQQKIEMVAVQAHAFSGHRVARDSVGYDIAKRHHEFNAFDRFRISHK